jgi:phage terminase Nu1 subunit (DNA packaging protein)
VEKERILELLEETADTAILAGLLNTSAATVATIRKTGDLPSDIKSSYRVCISHYCAAMKRKSAGKASNAMEAKMMGEARLTEVKTEVQLLELQEKRKTLIDVNVFAEVFEQTFFTLNAGLILLSKTYPEAKKDITKLMQSLVKIGEDLNNEALQEELNFREVFFDDMEVDEAEGTGLSSFGGSSDY